MSRPGYILYADPAWVQFHLRHSQGGAIGYCRGAGAPMKNVAVGGTLFFLTRASARKEVAFWADFESSSLVSVDEAWQRFGTELGAATYDDWRALISRLPRINSSGQLIVVRGINAQIPPRPVTLHDVGVVVVNHATKGWSIGQEDVDRLLGS